MSVFSTKTCIAKVTKVARDVDRLERCVCVEFQQGQVQGSTPESGHIHRLCEVIGNSTEEKNLGVLVNEKLNMNQK